MSAPAINANMDATMRTLWSNSGTEYDTTVITKTWPMITCAARRNGKMAPASTGVSTANAYHPGSSGFMITNPHANGVVPTLTHQTAMRYQRDRLIA